MYLYCVMADVATETNDKPLLNACKAIWDDLVQKKIHITGGIGPTHANTVIHLRQKLASTAMATTASLKNITIAGANGSDARAVLRT